MNVVIDPVSPLGSKYQLHHRLLGHVGNKYLKTMGDHQCVNGTITKSDGDGMCAKSSSCLNTNNYRTNILERDLCAVWRIYMLISVGSFDTRVSILNHTIYCFVKTSLHINIYIL